MKRDNCKCKDVRIVEESFGQIPSENADTSSDETDSTKVKSYRMSNNYGTEVIVITWGATIVSIKCLDKYGQPADIVLGFDNLDSYLDPRLSQMMGCIVGRCAQSVEEELASRESQDSESHQGGPVASSSSFGRRLWEAYVEDDCRVVMSYLSPDGEDGYPGALLTSVKFELTRSNSLEIAMRAVSSKPTTVNLSHSCIFNLAGHASGPDELRAHEVSLNCDRWIQSQSNADDNYPPKIRRVGGTAMDLRVPRLLGQLMDELPDEAAGPHYLAITRGATAASLQSKVRFASRILHRKTGRFLEVYSDQPGLDFCAEGPSSLVQRDRRPTSGSSANSSSGKDACLNAAACDCSSDSSTTGASRLKPEEPVTLDFLPGKCGAKYKRFGGLSLVPRNRLASANIKPPLFPSAALRPGQVYYHDLLYKFGVDLDNDCLP